MRVLAIGAHPDDIELGCGGSLAAHRAAGHDIALLIMTTGEQGPQAARSRVEEQQEAAALLGAPVYWGGFEDGEVPDGRAPVAAIEQVMSDFAADLVYTHSPRDTHQDHRTTGHASLAAARRCSRVLMYESPSSTGFCPTMFVDLAEYVETKLSLIRAHISQVLKNGLVDLEAIEALARHRGFTARLRYAEGFETDRFVLPIGPTSSDDREIDVTREEIGVAG